MVIDSSRSMFAEGRRLNVSATILYNTAMWCMLGSKYLSTSLHHTTLWDAPKCCLIGQVLWSENTYISYPKMIPRNCLRHSTTKRSYFYVVVWFNCAFESPQLKNAIGLFFLIITTPSCLSEASVCIVKWIVQYV